MEPFLKNGKFLGFDCTNGDVEGIAIVLVNILNAHYIVIPVCKAIIAIEEKSHLLNYIPW